VKHLRVFEINDHLISFYTGRPPQAQRPRGASNWKDSGALDVGISTFVIHRGAEALVYDTFPTREAAQWVRDHLAERGIERFKVVNSHWHLDHIGGNSVYADVDTIATQKTIEIMRSKLTAIEAGTEWGPPPIRPLVIPNIGITEDSSYAVGDIKVELRPVNIHSQDGLVVYLPRERILLAGDTLEDTVTFIAEPEHLVSHYQNLQAMNDWNIARIYPNHGNPEIIAGQGYDKTLIAATLSYLRKVILRAHDPDYLKGTLEEYVADSVAKGWVSLWWAYHEPHAINLERTALALKGQPLPTLSE
jgi:glyoxylase-like metal-dependent hydrolase (beta-lactamase superfamily II)